MRNRDKENSKRGTIIFTDKTGNIKLPSIGNTIVKEGFSRL